MDNNGKLTRPSYRIENIQTILTVRDMKISREFYVDILGFQECDWGDDTFTSFSKDGGSIYLCKGAQGHPGTWVWVGFDGDIAELREQLFAKNVKIRMEPRNYSWAMEMHIEDPDGHVLRFGTDPDGSKPFLDGTGF